MVRIVLVGLVMSLWTAAAVAQQWADKMFEVKSHDFGAVPRAAKVEFPFTLTNLYKDDVHIVSVRSSCGCTSPRIEKDTLKANEQGSIIAAFNTNAFTGQRGARVTVTIDRPQYAEVQLEVKGYIRTDVVLSPGQVSFGSVPENEVADKKIRIDYAGRNDWQITGVTPSSPFVTADVKEISRTAGHVTYELDVQLKEGAPVGYLNDQIILATNDRRATQFPVNVEARIASDLSVNPTTLMLGSLEPSQRVTKQIVVKGSKPFKIVEIRCEDSSFTFQPSDESKALHLVPVIYEAGDKTGKISEKIQIVTDLSGDKSVELTVIGQVGAPLAGK